MIDDTCVPKVSVFDTRLKQWQDRKRWWIEQGIESGRGRHNYRGKDARISIFDPYLCEIMYKWYCPDGGRVLDPFAGGSVRGFVAASLGLEYVGIDLSQEQIEEDMSQTSGLSSASYICGDSCAELGRMEGPFDMIFSCPPYWNLERYSYDPRDLSNMPYDKFLNAYRDIVSKSCKLLNEGGFAVFVVGEVRDKSDIQTGYVGFVRDTISAFMDAGMSYWGEIILLQPFAFAGMRMRGYWDMKNLVKVHQNVLVFRKRFK